MRKKIVAVCAAAVVLVAVILSPHFINNYSAARNIQKLESLPLPEGTERIESLSLAQRLGLTGNGMQFFGALLVESDLSLEELREFYSAYDGCTVKEQLGKKIDIGILMKDIYFETEPDPDKSYYIIYSWGEGVPPFTWLDIRGF